ncbi:hypothetical protein VPH35_051590 [Triticum aestivum]
MYGSDLQLIPPCFLWLTTSFPRKRKRTPPSIQLKRALGSLLIKRVGPSLPFPISHLSISLTPNNTHPATDAFEVSRHYGGDGGAGAQGNRSGGWVEFQAEGQDLQPHQYPRAQARTTV